MQLSDEFMGISQLYLRTLYRAQMYAPYPYRFDSSKTDLAYKGDVLIFAPNFGFKAHTDLAFRCISEQQCLTLAECPGWLLSQELFQSEWALIF